MLSKLIPPLQTLKGIQSLIAEAVRTRAAEVNACCCCHDQGNG